MTENIQQEDTKPEETKQEETSVNKEEKPPIKTEENETNWKKFREERERERKAREEAEALAKKRQQEADALKLAMDALLQEKKNPQHHDDYDDDDEDARIQKRIEQAFAAERKRIQEENESREREQMPQRLQQNFKDFNKVCSAENLDYLEYHYPEIAKAYQYMPESYDKWESVYKAVKRFVPYGNREQDQKRIEQNMQKPQAHSPNLTDTKPESTPWRLTEEKRMENWRRMQRDMKSFS